MSPFSEAALLIEIVGLSFGGSATQKCCKRFDQNLTMCQDAIKPVLSSVD